MFEPMPSIRAPMATSRRHRSCTCGSQAAWWIVGDGPRPGRGHERVLRAGDATASSRWNSVPLRPPGARKRYVRSAVTSAPSASSASRWVSTRRRPITSPPGGGTSRAAAAREQRAGQQDRGADALREPLVERRRVDVGSADAHLVALRPLDLRAEVDEQLEHGLDVADARHVAEHHGLCGEDGRGEQREGGSSCCPRGGSCP